LLATTPTDFIVKNTLVSTSNVEVQSASVEMNTTRTYIVNKQLQQQQQQQQYPFNGPLSGITKESRYGTRKVKPNLTNLDLME